MGSRSLIRDLGLRLRQPAIGCSRVKRPRITPSVRRLLHGSRLADEVCLFQRHTVVAQDVIGRRHMKIKVR